MAGDKPLSELLREIADMCLTIKAAPCAECGARIGWVDCPTGGWWAHLHHPADNHEARPMADLERYHTDALLHYLVDTLWRIQAVTGTDQDGDTGPQATIAGMGIARFADAVLADVARLRTDYDEES